MSAIANRRSLTLGTGLLLALMPLGVGAQPARGVVAMVSGQATVARPSLAHPAALKFKDALFERDRIDTAQHSLMRVLLGGKALITVRELSTLIITEDGSVDGLRISEGKLAIGVARSRMRPGEALEIHTPNAVAAVRGTVLVVEILPPSVPGGTPNTLITVTRGVVGVTPLGAPGQPEVAVQAGQRYDVAADYLRLLTPDEVIDTFADLTGGSRPTLSGDVAENLWLREAERTGADATVFLSPETSFNPWATVLDQALGTSSLNLITDTGSRVTGPGCGGGVGGGAGVGCRGTGRGAAHGRRK